MIDSGAWTVRARRPDLVLTDPVEFTTGRLVENYGPPDLWQITGRLLDLRPLLQPGYGCFVVDTAGQQKFSGIVDPEGFERRGDGTGTVTFVADTVNLWDRICYPVPASDWTTAGQNAVHDVQTGSVEDRILGYVNRNLGPAARTERRLTSLHLPATGARGSVGTSRLRFDVLGQVVATLAETANLRVRIVHNENGWLDLVIDDAPDLSAWARYGDGRSGGPGLLGSDWSYRFGPMTGSAVLCAAGGEGTDRNLGKIVDVDAQSLWNRRVESFLDQRGTGELPDATKTLAEAVKERAVKQRARDNANAALKAAQANLAEHPSSTSAQDARDTAQDNYASAQSDYTAAAAEVTAATTARNAAAVADTTAINEALAEALAGLVGASDVAVPISNSGYQLGTEIPVGAKVAAELDGELITERIRQIETTIAVTDGDARVRTSAVLGSPDAPLQSPTQRKLAAMQRRLDYLERS